MTDSSILPFDQRPVVVVFADPSALATAFVEALVADLAKVRIVSNEVAKWREQINHLAQNKSDLWQFFPDHPGNGYSRGRVP